MTSPAVWFPVDSNSPDLLTSAPLACTSRARIAARAGSGGEAGADPGDQRTWLPWLERSAERFGALLRETRAAWLARRVEMIDTLGATLSGWRVLMMMIEHEVHHRSRIDAYAGLEGWPVPDIFNRSAESIDALQSAQRTRHRR
jgi:hypothetical protein